MKLEKAIEILTDEVRYLTEPHHQDYKDASKLLIEAGKRIKRMRKDNAFLSPPPLPGES